MYPSKPLASPVAIVMISTETVTTPQAGWFDTADTVALRKAASRRTLRCIDVPDAAYDVVITLVGKGTLAADGMVVLMPIAADKLAKLLQALSDETPSAMTGSLPAAAVKQAGSVAEDDTRAWATLSVNATVLAPQTTAKHSDEGWWEAIIIAVQGDTFTLRWRDYPEEEIIKRKRNQLAMLYPAAK